MIYVMSPQDTVVSEVPFAHTALEWSSSKVHRTVPSLMRFTNSFLYFCFDENCFLHRLQKFLPSFCCCPHCINKNQCNDSGTVIHKTCIWICQKIYKMEIFVINSVLRGFHTIKYLVLLMYLIIYLAYMCSECTITLVFFFFLSEMLDMVYEVDF